MYRLTEERVRGALADKQCMASPVKLNTNGTFIHVPFLILQRNSPWMASDPPMGKGKRVSETLEAHEPFSYFR